METAEGKNVEQMKEIAKKMNKYQDKNKNR